MDITLKNIQHNERMSEETHCFTATVYVDGKRAFIVSNHGHGGANFYQGVKGGVDKVHETVAKIDAELGKEKCEPPYESMDNCLEFVIGDLVNQWLTDREIKRVLKKVCFVRDGEVYTSKYKATPEHVAGYKNASWFKDQSCIMLNDMPIEEVRKYF